MTLGDLVINISVKGSDKTKESIGGVKEGLGAVKSMALETKVAIIATFYELEKLMAASARTGQNLSNFGALTGLSVQELQKWEYGARQAGLGADEMASTFKGLLNVAASIARGDGAPKGLQQVADVVGLEEARLGDAFYTARKLRDYAKATAHLTGAEIGIANQNILSFGGTLGFISGSRRHLFDENILAKAPAYSDKQTKRLGEIDAAWANLWKQIEMTIGKINAQHGLKLIDDISKLVTQVSALTKALVTLSEKLHVFEVLSEVIQQMAEITGIGGKVVDYVTGQVAAPKGDATSVTSAAMKRLFGGSGAAQTGLDFLQGRRSALPRLPGRNPQSESPTFNFHIQNNGVEDMQDAVDLLRQDMDRTTDQYYRTSPAQQVGT